MPVGQTMHPMDNQRTPSRHVTATHEAPAKLLARRKRQAAALRANLHKRKAQERAREGSEREQVVVQPAQLDRELRRPGPLR
jgi:hypothetical protein